MGTKLPLVTEGEWSKDGSRYITMESTTWREPPLPVTRPGVDRYASSIIGKVTRVWREDNVVYGEFELFEPGPGIKSITVDTMKGEYSIDEDHGGMVIEHPEIMGGCGWQDNRYIWEHDD